MLSTSTPEVRSMATARSRRRHPGLRAAASPFPQAASRKPVQFHQRHRSQQRRARLHGQKLAGHSPPACYFGRSDGRAARRSLLRAHGVPSAPAAHALSSPAGAGGDGSQAKPLPGTPGPAITLNIDTPSLRNRSRRFRFRYSLARRMKVKGVALRGAWWDRWARARVTDVAKCRCQGLVVCRAALPFEGLLDACPGVTLAPSSDGCGVPGWRASRGRCVCRRSRPVRRALSFSAWRTALLAAAMPLAAGGVEQGRAGRDFETSQFLLGQGRLLVCVVLFAAE